MPLEINKADRAGGLIRSETRPTERDGGVFIQPKKTWSSGPVEDPAMGGSNFYGFAVRGRELFWSAGASPIVDVRLQIDEWAAV